jgi:hypothetical protein
VCDPDLFSSNVLNDIMAKHGSHLLPLAFPEGSPVHTAYGSGHASVAGACVSCTRKPVGRATWTGFASSTMVPSPRIATLTGLDGLEGIAAA